MPTSKRHPVRTLVILLIVILVGIASLVVGTVTNKGASFTPKLALDLEGGTQLILTPIATDDSNREITDTDIQEAIGIIRDRVDASGVAEAEITSMGSNNISVSLPGHPSEETLDLIRSSSQMDFRPVLEMGAATTTSSTDSSQSGSSQSGTSESGDSQSGTSTQSGDTAQSGTVTTAIPAEEAQTYADTDGDGQLSDTPTTTPTDNSDTAWITEQTLYDFYTLDCTDPSSRAKGSGSDSSKAYVTCNTDGTVKFILGPVDVKGSDVTSATAGMGANSTGQSTGQWVVNLEFNDEGTQAFADSSQRLYAFKDTDSTRNAFAIVLDGSVISYPTMNGAITDGKAQISGSFTASTAKALANQLNFGSLPLDFQVQSEQQISATLGTDHLEKGIWAGVIGMVLVFIYMIWQYHALSVLSAGSMILAGGITYLTIAILSWVMGYRLSLPGVAGLIMAVGVTADSFIVYFERIRDEVRDGRPLAVAVDEGWDRAKRTIMVSDGVNLVAAVILYMLAVGGVQGFAFTLGVTTVVDLVVIFFFTHPIMELLVRVPFFGEGHRFSGFDPEHLGAKSGAVYAGRGRVAHREPKGASASSAHAVVSSVQGAGEVPKSLAERRFEAAHAGESIDHGPGAVSAEKPDTDQGGDAVDRATDEPKGDAR